MVSLHRCGSCRDSFDRARGLHYRQARLGLHSNHKESLDAVDRDAVRFARTPWEFLAYDGPPAWAEASILGFPCPGQRWKAVTDPMLSSYAWRFSGGEWTHKNCLIGRHH